MPKNEILYAFEQLQNHYYSKLEVKVVMEYIEKKPYFEKMSMLEKVFYILFNEYETGNKKRLYIRPQYKCGNYKIDYVIYPEKEVKIAIELDGFAFHDRDKKQFQYERKRALDITKKGYTLIRFTWEDIVINFDRVYEDIYEIYYKLSEKAFKAKNG